MVDGPEIARRMREADALYSEPRTAERVLRVLEICLDSVSLKDHHGALWRAARACSWLAARHPDESRRRYHALQGVHIGAAAGRRGPGRPESYYYHAINLGLLSRLEGRGVRRVPIMEDLALKVVELDERYEYAGGDRFLGLLYFRTMDHPLIARGDIDDALEHLERACELFPDHGGNRLALAEVLAEDGELDEARRHLELVRAGRPPVGEEEEHREWVERAGEMLEEITTR